MKALCANRNEQDRQFCLSEKSCQDKTLAKRKEILDKTDTKEIQDKTVQLILKECVVT